MRTRNVLRVTLAVILVVAVTYGSIVIFDELISMVRPGGLPAEIGDSELNTIMVAGSVGAAFLIGIIVFRDLSK
jgi:hypothetical protein